MQDFGLVSRLITDIQSILTLLACFGFFNLVFIIAVAAGIQGYRSAMDTSSNNHYFQPLLSKHFKGHTGVSGILPISVLHVDSNCSRLLAIESPMSKTKEEGIVYDLGMDRKTDGVEAIHVPPMMELPGGGYQCCVM